MESTITETVTTCDAECQSKASAASYAVSTVVSTFVTTITEVETSAITSQSAVAVSLSTPNVQSTLRQLPTLRLWPTPRRLSLQLLFARVTASHFAL